MSDAHKMSPQQETEETVSKSQLKREAKAIVDFADQLVSLPNKLFLQLPLTEELREAISVARKLDNRNARKRQLKYIARLLEKINLPALQAFLEESHQQSLVIHSRRQQIEDWCDELLSGDSNLIDQLVEEYSHLERQTLRQLVRQSLKNASNIESPPDNRKLFRYLLDNT